MRCIRKKNEEGKSIKRQTVRGIAALAAAAYPLSATACGKLDISEQRSTQDEARRTNESRTAETRAVKSSEAAKEAFGAEKSTPAEMQAQEAELTFADLSGYVFEFSSGAGAWSTTLTIEKDGYFHGLYHDSDMGDRGGGYDNGTVYCSVFSGHFSDLTKLDDTIWEMRLADISYRDKAGETQIDGFDKIRYIYTEAYGLAHADTFRVYWTGTPAAALSDEVMSWLSVANGSESKLTMPAIADDVNELAFFSHERQTPREEAKTLLKSYQSSYDALDEKLMHELSTQGDMNLCAQKMYENSDECLNLLWNLVKYNADEGRFNEILEEQRAWIKEKEAAEKSIGAEWEGGSGQILAVDSALARLTMERCRMLAGYLAE